MGEHAAHLLRRRTTTLDGRFIGFGGVGHAFMVPATSEAIASVCPTGK
jgi:hypothetical protein